MQVQTLGCTCIFFVPISSSDYDLKAYKTKKLGNLKIKYLQIA